MPVLVTSAISHFTFLYFPTLSKYTVFLLASYEGMLAILYSVRKRNDYLERNILISAIMWKLKLFFLITWQSRS